ncbi:MAG: Hsp70 family protein [Alistipes senegalensis]|nr:Hsp70 family protein [Oxalobacter formigenes]MCM1281641.1 Hsp70 family protein [Alistipes senegalensis]
MKNFIGIDLGTTNSAICSYDGAETRIWRSPEQNDVTPSAIYIDRRGNKYVGKRAYDSAPHSPGNAAMLFKRLMGTSTPVPLPAVNQTKTPEECSAEVLKVLFGYLPEEIRNDPDTGTVITVPAAFNQMQKDATMQAADMAGIGNVALMQEPVAAVMSVMRARNTDGMFLIYDLGGGTLDIAIAESIGQRVNLLAHGGIAMCGGRDFDRTLVDNIIHPWLLENFDLPEDFSVNPDFRQVNRLAAWAAERAKIELSSREGTVISLSETEARIRDLGGNEIYLDIPLQRDTYNKLIAARVDESIASARETLEKAGLSPHDLERIVFIGGPTNYKPLRDKVAFELGIPGNTDVNPMTAVAEGASLFAESIDWQSRNRARKNSRGQITSGGSLALSFNYMARTPDTKAKIVLQLAGEAANGAEFQIDSMDTGWTSGRLPLRQNASLDVALTKNGDNLFKVFVFDTAGSPVSLKQDKIVITRTAATVDAIPASHSVGIEVLEKLGGRPTLDYLVRSGDSLPKKGKKVFKAAESLKAGAAGSLNLKLWEGEIEDPVTDNRPVGVLKISGADFDEGVIPAGADLECTFEILDSGNILMEVSVPCIGGTFHAGKNFYSRQEGQIDYTAAAAIVAEEGEKTQARIDEISQIVANPKLEQARQKLASAASLDLQENEVEKSQEAMEKVLEAKKLLAQVRKEHLKEIRRMDLDNVASFFDKHVREYARPSESSAFDNLVKTAQRAIEKNDRDFEHHIDELRGKNFDILWRQDWFVVERFKWMAGSPHLFADKSRFEELVQAGTRHMRDDDIDKLRAIAAQLSIIRIGGSPDNDILDAANIIRG